MHDVLTVTLLGVCALVVIVSYIYTDHRWSEPEDDEGDEGDVLREWDEHTGDWRL